MSDPRVELIKQALSGEQTGGGLDDIRVFMGLSKQIGRGFGEVIRNIGLNIAPILFRAAKTLFKTSSESLKDGGSIGD